MSIRDILVTGVTSKLPGDYAVIHEPRKEMSPVVSQDGRKVITFTLHEAAIGKPRMVASDKWKKRKCVVKYREWADRLREVAGQLPKANQIESLTITSKFVPPESWSKKRRLAAIGQFHRVKPDSSNILKGVEDVLWPGDDSGLADVRSVKLYGWEPSMTVTIVTNQE